MRRRTPIPDLVIPANAGIQRPHEGFWTPAFAGATEGAFLPLALQLSIKHAAVIDAEISYRRTPRGDKSLSIFTRRRRLVELPSPRKLAGSGPGIDIASWPHVTEDMIYRKAATEQDGHSHQEQDADTC